MSAASLTLRTRRRPIALVRNVASSRRRDGRRIVGCFLVGVLTSCGAHSAAQPGRAASSVPIPSASPATADDQTALLAQYRKFWSSLTPVSRMPAAERRAALAGLAVDPALKSLLKGMAANDAASEVFYGAHLPNPKPVPVSPDGSTALVDDCQDSTRTGLADKLTLKPKTRGVPKNHVNVTMKRSSGGVWKVAFVAYTKTPC
jgi:hypothetical protein